MKAKAYWITKTAVLLALLMVLQAVTKGFGQLVTGSCVNAVLASAFLLGGLSSGLVIALLSPVLAFVLGIAPQLITVPVIMMGNAVYVLVLFGIWGTGSEGFWKKTAGWFGAAVLKFMVLYILVAEVICGFASHWFMEAGLLKEGMLSVLPAMFAWPQLFTALVGGAVALLIVPRIKHALHNV